MLRNKAVGEKGTSEDPPSEDKEGWSHEGVEW